MGMELSVVAPRAPKTVTYAAPGRKRGITYMVGDLTDEQLEEVADAFRAALHDERARQLAAVEGK